MVNVLIVEDERIVALDLKLQLKRVGYNVPFVAACADDVFKNLDSAQPDIVLMDIHIQGPRDGIEVAEAIRRTSDLPIIFVTGQADLATMERACLTEASGYIVKPVSFPSLHGSIEMALHRGRASASHRLSDPDSSAVVEAPPLDDSRDLASIPWPLVIIGSNGRIVFANASLERFLGYQSGELTSMPVETLCIAQNEEGSPMNNGEILESAANAGTSRLKKHFYLARKGGARLLAEVVFEAITLEADQFTLISVFARKARAASQG